MTKTLTKEQFRQMAFPTVEGKNVIPAKMELLPGDKGLINGNLYSIDVKVFEDLVILTKIQQQKVTFYSFLVIIKIKKENDLISKNNQLVNIYYDLFEYLDSMELFIDAIKYFTKTPKFKSAILVQLENLRMLKIEDELNQLYDLPLNTLKDYAMRWKLRNKAKMVKKYQSNIFDFLGE